MTVIKLMLRLLVLYYQFPQLYYQYIPQLALVDIRICIPPQMVITQNKYK